ncbi:hypothetical protein DPMN_185160 [Dreissena polymorpha]|uniref:Uncharacterized protein n=1 Tax=Dreissena polymorpha TaxID=45954 RepID=A0A9D4DJ65_DREPO|nr:hypothetical protein DPMN_185160 [Dreissena polymorpha]
MQKKLQVRCDRHIQSIHFTLIWNNPDKYKNHFVLIGTFHLTGAYFKMVSKKMSGSGLSDIMLEAGLIGSGSIQGVFTGRHFEGQGIVIKLLLRH